MNIFANAKKSKARAPKRPDHVAGLTALAINQPVGPAVSLASVWAGGHVTGQCFIGAALVRPLAKLAQ